MILATSVLASAPDFPEARDFPEAPPPAADSGREDFFTSGATYLVRLSRKARVRYESGRVATLHACQALGVDEDGTVRVRMYGDGRLLNVKLAGVQFQPIPPYTPEQTYGWKGGPLVDRADRDRVVALAEMERHALLSNVYRRDFWVEFEGDPPSSPYKANYPGYLYNVGGTRNMNTGSILNGDAHAAAGARSGAYLQSLQDRAAQARSGLWDEARWRGEEARGFAYLKRMPLDPRTGTRPPTPPRPGPKGRPR